MEAEEVSAIVGDLPWMTPAQGKAITTFVRAHEIRNVLELGFCHGVSTCYLAAAVGAEGSVTTIDKLSARSLDPSAEALLTRAGLKGRVSLHYEARSYNWRLMRLLESDPTPRFDLCFIDGAHSWLEDGFAFFLVDRLLREGGWIIFDDLDWRIATAPDPKSRERSANMDADERETAQVRKVYDLLVRTHPDYGQFRTEDSWGYARKLAIRSAGELRTETVVKTLPVPLEMMRHLMDRESKSKAQR